MHYKQDEGDSWKLRIVSDASLAPGGARSRSGVALLLGATYIVGWKSQRQAFAAWSATEAELDAPTPVFQDGSKLFVTLETILDQKLKVLANNDNSRTIQLLGKRGKTRSHVDAKPDPFVADELVTANAKGRSTL